MIVGHCKYSLFHIDNSHALVVVHSPIHSLHYSTQNKKAMEGTISKDKLREEVVAPYKQNWIGFFSMMIVILATIATKFPEAMEIPVIKIPDL